MATVDQSRSSSFHPDSRDAVLSVADLAVEFRTSEGTVKAVDGVSFSIAPGEALGIVGESGSGKSVMNLAIMGLIPQPPGRIVQGSARFRGQDLLQMSKGDLANVRGRYLSMVFQDPMTSLNPFLSVGEQLAEVTERHLGHSRKEGLRCAIEMLERVGIPGAAARIHDFPHQFSGGMRQRVMIAMALICHPDLVIADEPTTALDVTIQAQILDLLNELRKEEKTAVILITHDLGVVASMCERVNVMYAGRFVEEASVDELFASPRHPYTRGLLGSIPRAAAEGSHRLTPIVGQPPDLTRLPSGCAFEPRCPDRISDCATLRPPVVNLPADHRHACLLDITQAPPVRIQP